MAHLRAIASQCQQPGCTKRAVNELYNQRNGLMGVYCAPHAQAALRALAKAEAAAD